VRTIALTGSIGSGKTTIANIFTSLNVPVISADKIAADLTDVNTLTRQKIVERFGEFDRKKLREIIFTDLKQKTWLEQLLHPLIKKQIFAEISRLSAEKIHPYCIIEIPLLFETSMEKDFDRVLLVTCDAELQISRSAIRDKASPKQITAIINQQISNNKKLNLADDIIQNNNSIDTLITHVTKLHKQYQHL
jgi:dephospho-CoA kinase